jgi:hypothetical protein
MCVSVPPDERRKHFPARPRRAHFTRGALNHETNSSPLFSHCQHALWPESENRPYSGVGELEPIPVGRSLAPANLTASPTRDVGQMSLAPTSFFFAPFLAKRRSALLAGSSPATAVQAPLGGAPGLAASSPRRCVETGYSRFRCALDARRSLPIGESCAESELAATTRRRRQSRCLSTPAGPRGGRVGGIRSPSCCKQQSSRNPRPTQTVGLKEAVRPIRAGAASVKASGCFAD